MSKKRAQKLEVAAKGRPQTELFLDHTEITEGDFESLKAVRFLILWNVKVPAGFVASLPHLWSLDLRGGSATDLTVVKGANKLQCLIVNQIRGLRDLSVLPELRNLRCLMLYGLIRVTHLPSLITLKKLERVELGQMRGLKSLHGVLQAPRLLELAFHKKINVSTRDIQAIANHRTLMGFDWWEVPDSVCEPVINKIRLPKVESIYMEDWFRRQVGYPTKREFFGTVEPIEGLKSSIKSAKSAPIPDTEVVKDLHCVIKALEKDLRKQKTRDARKKRRKAT